MFTIRKEQMDAMGKDYRHRFYQKLVDLLRENLPRRTRGCDNQEMLRRIAAADIKAGTYGIVSERGIAQFVALSFLAGPEFDQRPMTQRFLRDSRIEPNHKIDTLFDYLVERGRQERGG